MDFFLYKITLKHEFSNRKILLKSRLLYIWRLNPSSRSICAIQVYLRFQRSGTLLGGDNRQNVD